MKPGTIIGDTLEQLKEEVKEGAKGAVKQVKGSPQPQAQQVSTKDVVDSLYGKTKKQEDTASTQNQQQPQTPADLEKIAKTKQELAVLHKTTYYDPLVNPKKVEEEKVEEEKKEKEEEQEKTFELEEKKKEKNQTLAQQRATQRVEKYPGASG